MKTVQIKKKNSTPGLHSITLEVQDALKKLLQKDSTSSSGVVHLFNMHTSSALLINESWDDSAKGDLERFFNYIAPENLPFIEHTLEGPDDSPAHMKTALLNQHLALIVEDSQMLLGRWQGIFLAEFRDDPPTRTILLKYQPD